MTRHAWLLVVLGLLLVTVPGDGSEIADGAKVVQYVGDRYGLGAVVALVLLGALLFFVYLMVTKFFGVLTSMSKSMEEVPRNQAAQTAATAAQTEVIRGLEYSVRRWHEASSEDHRRQWEQIADVARKVEDQDK